MYESITAEQAYLEAIRAAGPADDVNAWADKVEKIASIILERSKAFVQRENTFISPITLEGTIISVEENPVSQNTGNALGLFKVTFNGDNSKFPDSMWLDKNVPGDVEMFRIAQSNVGKRVRIEKRRKVAFGADGKPVTDNNGEVQTSPYLRAITPLEGGAPRAMATPAAQPAPATQHTASPLADLVPESAGQLLEMANQHLGLSADDAKAELQKILGPSQPGKKRTAAELKHGWVALVAAHAGNVAA